MESISKILQTYINNPSYAWVPIVAFTLTILFAAICGFINGWKTSLYFFGWNLTGWISGVFLLPTLISAVDSISFIKLLVGVAKDLLGIIALFAYLLVINILAFLIYLIFRKKLKKSMHRNKINKISNKYSRTLGFGIAVSSSIPSAVFLANSSAIMAPAGNFTGFLDSMTDKLTFGKYEGPSEARTIASNLDHITNFINSIMNKKVNGIAGDLGSEASKTALQKVLNTNFVNNINDIYEGLSSAGIIKPGSLDEVDAKDIESNLPTMGIKFNPGKEKALRESLSKMFADNSVVNAIIGQLTTAPNPKLIAPTTKP